MPRFVITPDADPNNADWIKRVRKAKGLKPDTLGNLLAGAAGEAKGNPEEGTGTAKKKKPAVAKKKKAKRKKMAEKKFTLKDVDDFLALVQKFIKEKKYVQAAQFLSAARNRLTLARGLPLEGNDAKS